MNEKEIERRLREAAYFFADACVSKAMAKLEHNPDRAKLPYRELSQEFLEKRLFDECKEYIESRDYRELLDIGNFAAWLWYSAYI